MTGRSEQPSAEHSASDAATEGACTGLDLLIGLSSVTALGLNALLHGLLPKRAYLPVSLATCGILSCAARQAGVPFEEQGLTSSDFGRSVRYGAVFALPVAALLLAGPFVEPFRPLYARKPILKASPARFAYEALVRIPFGTALPEEAIFRGTLLGLLLRRRHSVPAVLLSSTLFGVSHVAPVLAESRSIAGGRHTTDVASLTTPVTVTFFAGLLLCWLRLRSKSVVAPWIVHAAANSAACTAGWWWSRSVVSDSAARPSDARTNLEQSEDGQ